MQYYLKKYYIIILSALFLSCDDTQLTDIDDKDKFIPESNISYKNHIQPILDVKCASTQCHDNISKVANISFTNYYNTTADFKIVMPFEPLSSRLYQVLNPFDTKSMPPFPYPPLTEKQKKAVYQWILEGAKNN